MSVEAVLGWAKGGKTTSDSEDRAALSELNKLLAPFAEQNIFTKIVYQYFYAARGLSFDEAKLFADVWEAVNALVSSEESEIIKTARRAVLNNRALNCSEDFMLAKALLDDQHFREKLLAAAHSDLMDCFRLLLNYDSTVSEVQTVLLAYDQARGGENFLKLQELEEARQQAAELAERIAALEDELLQRR